MPDWSLLPPEIFDSIFSYLPQNEPLISSRLVCKSWAAMASVHLFKDMAIMSFERLVQFLNSEESKHIGHHVIHLYIKASVLTYRGRHNVTRMAAVCPNVQKFDTMIHFRGIWNIFKHVSTRWRLKQLPAPYSNEPKLYYDCAFAYRHSLTHLCIPQYTREDPVTQYGVSLLKQFKRLSHLSFRSSYFGQGLMDYDALVEECPYLTHLDIGKTFAYHEPFDPLVLDLAQVVPRKEIKTLKALIAYDVDLFKYLMHKFPNLKKLELNTHLKSIEPATVQLLRDYFTRNADHFIQYLNRIEEHEVFLLCTKELLGAYVKYSPTGSLETFIRPSLDEPSIHFKNNQVIVKCNIEQSMSFRSGDVQ